MIYYTYLFIKDECEKMFGHFLEKNQNDPKHKLSNVSVH